MKELLGRWRSSRAEAKFRVLEDEVWAERLPDREAIDVATTFGSTRAYRWPGTGEPVVLLHGIGGTSVMWAPYIGTLGDHAVTAIDTMGDVGRSVHERPFTGPGDIAEWLDETLERLGISSAHLIGTSFGGWLAFNQALRRPHRVASVMLIDPVGLAPLNMGGFLRWGFAVLFSSLLPAGGRRRAAARLGMPVLENKRAMQMVRRGQMSHRFRPEPSPFSDEELSSINAPVTVLVGERSAIHDPHAVVQRARRLMPDVDARVVAGAGHGLPLSHVDQVRDTWLSTRSRSA